MKKFMLLFLTMVMLLLTATTAFCADGYDCLKYLYGTWGVPRTDDTVSFDYEGRIIVADQSKYGITFKRINYTGIDGAHIDDYSRQGSMNLYFEDGKAYNIVFHNGNTIDVAIGNTATGEMGSYRTMKKMSNRTELQR